MIPFLAMMVPAIIVTDHFTKYPIIPPEAGQGWKLELFDLDEPIGNHYHKLQRQFVLVAQGELKALYGTDTPLLLKSSDLSCVDPGIVHSLIPEGRACFFTIDLPGFDYPDDVFFDEPQNSFTWSAPIENAIPPIDEKYYTQKIDKQGYIVYELIDGNATEKKYSASLLEILDSHKHFHQIETEIFLVVNGTLEIEIDGIWHILKACSSVTILPGSIHKLKSANDYPVRVLCFNFPAFDPTDIIAVESVEG